MALAVTVQVRFFGKFFGTHADYYVFETTLKTPPEEEAGEPADQNATPPEWNSGSNGYVYFVANTPGGPLTQLPHVTPAQVCIRCLLPLKAPHHAHTSWICCKTPGRRAARHARSAGVLCRR